MKMLLLMRHAEAAQGDASTRDHERPLTRHGKEDAHVMGTFLVQQGLTPETIISSTALRARETVAGLLETATFKTPVIFTRKLYLADTNALQAQSTRIHRDVDIAMLVGHNPGLGEFLNICCRVFQSMPAGAVAQVHFDVANWDQLTPDTRGNLINFWEPGDIQA